MLFGQDFLREQLFSASSEKTRLDGNAPQARCGPGTTLACNDSFKWLETVAQTRLVMKELASRLSVL